MATRGTSNSKRPVRSTVRSAKPAAKSTTLKSVASVTDPKDLDALLRYAAANPGSRQKLLPTAEAAYLRVARDLRKRAQALPPAARAMLEQRSNEQYFRAVVARNLPTLLRPPRKSPVPPAQPQQPLLPSAPPGVPQNVKAVAHIASASVSWDARPAAELVLGYTVTPLIGGTAQKPLNVGPATIAVFPALTPGTAYTFDVHATNLAGSSAEGASNAVTPTALSGSGAFAPTLPALSSDPVLLLDPLAAPALPLVEAATRTADKWRYEYVKELAIRSAGSALQFEQHISELMQLAMVKVTAAEQVLNPALINALSEINTIKASLADLGSSQDIDSLLPSMADLAAQALLLPRLLEFLATTSPIGFWISLFEAMISDLAAAIFADTSFSRTRKFLDHTFGTDAGIQAGIKDAAKKALQDLDAQIDGMTAPLRSAVSQVVAGTSQAMGAVFESFDLPLLLNTPAAPQLPDVPDVDPFLQLQSGLDSEIGQLTEKIRSAVHDRLNGLLSGSDSSLFVAIAVTYLVLPILAFLVISLAGGPFSAALLAAAVLLAVEELVHLVLSWLTGPLLAKVGELKNELGDVVKKIQQLFARASNLILNQSPVPSLDILANELRVLKDLAPQAYLDDAAALLRDARDVVLRSARDLAGAAEQAAGAELGTAFEVIQELYDNQLPAAPMLPGGADSGRFAAAALLRDLGKLEQQRTTVQDGKDLEVTHRLSLARLLGSGVGGLFGDFLTRREAVIHLDESQLTDRMFPGMYRVLLKDIRVSGLFATVPTLLASTGIPLSITHLGASSTRVKRRANPAAPPIDLPDFLRLPNLVPGDDAAAVFKSTVLLPAVDAAVTRALQVVFPTLPLQTYEIYVLALLVEIVLKLPDPIGLQYRDRLLQFPAEVQSQLHAPSLPDAVAAAVEAVLFIPTAGAGQPLRDGRGFVDLDLVRAATRSALMQAPWGDILGILLIGAAHATPGEIVPTANRDSARDHLINALLTGGGNALSLNATIGQVFDDAVAAYRKRIARWGGASFEEDPDPQVRALGYVRLVREAPAEASLFNLLPGSAATPQLQAQALSNSAEPTPLGALSSLQYRPFENRGLDGRLLLRLESLPDGLAQLGSLLPAQLSDVLSDVLLEVTVRGCYDPALAAAVRASRREESGVLAMAGAVLSPARNVLLPGTSQRVEAGMSELRTVHLSLRAHRDRSLLAWATAAQLAPAAMPNITALLAGSGGTPLAPLTSLVPFTPLEAVTDSLLVNFTFDKTPLPVLTTESALRSLASNLRLDPAALGFADFQNADAGLVGLGIAVIPTADGARAGGTLVTDAEPMGVQWQVDGLLAPLFDAAPTTLAPLPSRLTMTSISPMSPVRLADLFNAGTPPAIQVAIPAIAFGAKPMLYDVILSLSFRVPLPEAPTAIAAVR
ncbi:fibronectin type III domain-containing protein [Nevskia soli]|uniref:fibronectin type III domain-containing protein n=1 Tax=Nevskia soli TaxID=418856 RepID=UPI0004A77D1B|nr:fibronectin type III domain-containing protein [Nevskia soli]